MLIKGKKIALFAWLNLFLMGSSYLWMHYITFFSKCRNIIPVCAFPRSIRMTFHSTERERRNWIKVNIFLAIMRLSINYHANYKYNGTHNINCFSLYVFKSVRIFTLAQVPIMGTWFQTLHFTLAHTNYFLGALCNVYIRTWLNLVDTG